MSGEGAVARIQFAADWQETLEGDLRPGGCVTVEYTQARRRQIFGGRLAGRVLLHVQFAPGGQQLSAPLGAEPVTLAVPADAGEVVIWFQATEHAGREVWDSRFGQNYRFPVDRG
jgi:hypothetical protein